MFLLDGRADALDDDDDDPQTLPGRSGLLFRGRSATAAAAAPDLSMPPSPVSFDGGGVTHPPADAPLAHDAQHSDKVLALSGMPGGVPTLLPVGVPVGRRPRRPLLPYSQLAWQSSRRNSLPHELGGGRQRR